MRHHLIAGAMVMVGLAVWTSVSAAQASAASPREALVDVLVWGADLTIDPMAYPPTVAAELERVLQRSREYRSERLPPASSSAMQMLVHAAQVRYERRLVAVTDDPRARSLAVAYVDRLRPCYEWEGYHDCPEREAAFATEYQHANASGPFREFLLLLAAHRWLCTAEAYQYEKRPDGVGRSLRAYEQAIAAAQQSAAQLIRTAADELRARGRCWSAR